MDGGAVENGTYLYCANGGHMSMYDDQETYFKGLIHFMKGVNKGEKKISFLKFFYSLTQNFKSSLLPTPTTGNYWAFHFLNCGT